MADEQVIAQLRAQMSAIESGSAGMSNDGADEGRGQAGSSRHPVSSRAGGAGGADAAFRKIVSLANASDKPERVIRDRLAAAGFDAAAIEEAVEKARDYAIIDDARYAEVLVRSRYNQGRGIAGIERELASARIDPSHLPFWDEWIESAAGCELDRALELLKRKPPRSKNVREGAYRKLVQKGYASSVASTAARIWADSAE